MGNRGNTKWSASHVQHWRVIDDNRRQLPCHPSIKVRVKINEPGVQARWCDRCGRTRYFRLAELPGMEGLLRLTWLSDSEALEHEQAEGPGIEDILPGTTPGGSR